MGIIRKGILGGFSGKVGNVIGGTWKGIEYMRSKANRGKFTPTESQHAQQLKFKLLMEFLQPMTGLLRITFSDFAVKMTGINNALSFNIKNAVTGTYPVFQIDYPLALVSRGDLPNALGTNSTMGAGGILTYSWTDNSGVGIAKPEDQAVFVAFCPELKQAIYTTAGGRRDSLTGDLDVSPFTGKDIHTYIAFVSETTNRTSVSYFTGTHTVS